METKTLQKLIGKEVLVIAPRSKNKNFEPATIISVSVSIQKLKTMEDFSEKITYYVKLHRTTTKTGRFKQEYNQCFFVSGADIELRTALS